LAGGDLTSQLWGPYATRGALTRCHDRLRGNRKAELGDSTFPRREMRPCGPTAASAL